MRSWAIKSIWRTKGKAIKVYFFLKIYRAVTTDEGESKAKEHEVLFTETDGKVATGLDVKAVVKAEILSDLVQGDKVIAFKMKRRKGFRKKHGHRTHYTKIHVTEIA